MRKLLLASLYCSIGIGLSACNGCGADPENNSTATQNAKPVAMIDAPSMGVVGAEVELDGASSTDADGDELEYAWELTGPDGSSSTLSSDVATKTGFTPDVAGDYTATLVVHDGVEDSEPVSVTINVIDAPIPNMAPIADAGEDQDVVAALGEDTVTLDGSASSDPEGADLTYTWSLTSAPDGADVSLAGEDAASATFVPAVAGEYVFELLVSDGELEATDSVTVNVTEAEPPNRAPVAEAGDAQSVILGGTVNLDASGSTDEDGDELSYSWQFVGDPSLGVDALVDADTRTASFVPSVVGEFEVELTVSDPDGEFDTDVVTITVEPVPNAGPTAEAGMMQDATVGQAVTLDGSASTDVEDDAAGLELVYSWSFDARPIGSTATLTGADTVAPTFVPDREGLYSVSLTVADSEGATAFDTVSINATAIANDAPVAEAGDAQMVLVGAPVTLDGTNSTDAEDDAAGVPLAFSWLVTSEPMGSALVLSAEDSAQPSFTPTVAGDYTFLLTVTDSLGAMNSDTVTITAAEITNAAPVASAGVAQGVTARTVVSLDASGSTDAEDDAAGIALTYAWSVESQPAGSSVSLVGSTTTSPTFTPLVGGDYTLRVTVTDSLGIADTDDVTVTVTNASPVANAGPGQFANVGTPVTLDGSASTDAEDDADGVALGYAWTVFSQPAGASVQLSDANTAQATFLATVEGVYTFNLRVTDSGGETSSSTVSVNVSGLNDFPTPIAGPDQTVTLGATVTLDGSGSTDTEDDAAGTPLSYSWLVSQEPAGANTMLSASDMAITTFTPTLAGTYELTLIVSDSQGAALPDSVLVTVLPPATNCLIISQVLEGTSNNKAIELFNCGTADLDLSGYRLTVLTNGAASSTNSITLGGTLASNAVHTICNPGAVIVDPSSCDVSSGTATGFNGDDTIVLFTDANADGNFDLMDGDAVVDAFGQIGATYAPGEFADEGYDRCNPVAFDGQSAFVVTSYYLVNTNTNDPSGFGIPPTASACSTGGGNMPPVADAGADATASIGDVVILDASGSSDFEDDQAGTALAFIWTVVSQPSGSNLSLTDRFTSSPSFIPSENGDYTFEVTVTDSNGASAQDSVTITVGSAVSDCLIISEYIEGSANNKAVELYNCGAAAVDLSSYHMGTFQSGALTTSGAIALSGSLAAGDVLTICNNGLDKVALGVTCDVDSNGPTSFNGDDAVGVFQDVNGDGEFDLNDGDITIDVFGELGADFMGVRPYSNRGYSRCDFTPFSGFGPFVPTALYNEDFTLDNFAGFGAAPTAGCNAAQNTAPTSNAGADQTVALGAQVVLDATGSSDTEDDAAMISLSYSWSVITEPLGANTTLTSATSSTPAFTPAVAGTYTFGLTVTDSGGLTDTDDVTILVTSTQGGNDCLIISQVLEGASNNKAVELYNCGMTSIDLGSYGFAVLFNGATSASAVAMSATLMPGDTHVICHSSQAVLGAGVCDQSTGSLSFNGNDSIVVYKDTDSVAGFDSNGDAVVDAFIEIGDNSGGFNDKNFERCDFTPYDGFGPFTGARYTDSGSISMPAGFGVAPTETCSGNMP